MLTELSRCEKAAGIKPDMDIDVFMKAVSVEGQQISIITDYTLKMLGLDICANTIVCDQMKRGTKPNKIPVMDRNFPHLLHHTCKLRATQNPTVEGAPDYLLFVGGSQSEGSSPALHGHGSSLQQHRSPSFIATCGLLLFHFHIFFSLTDAHPALLS
ncbi:hypothetical protein L7F22_040086 [Adiantum nelumboides]|nr:hypothetical protein [Adiantum nelumboides]